MAPSPQVWRSVAGPSGPALKGARTGASSSPSRVRCLGDDDDDDDDEEARWVNFLRVGIYMYVAYLHHVSRRFGYEAKIRTKVPAVYDSNLIVSATKQKSESAHKSAENLLASLRL